MKNIIKKRVLKIVATIVFAGLGSQHAISQDLDLEKDELKFGFIKLTDCAPIVIAKEKGFPLHQLELLYDNGSAIDAPHGLPARCYLKDSIKPKHSVSQGPHLYIRSATGDIQSVCRSVECVRWGSADMQLRQGHGGGWNLVSEHGTCLNSGIAETSASMH